MLTKAFSRSAVIAFLAASAVACNAKPALVNTLMPGQQSANTPTPTRHKETETPIPTSTSPTPAAGLCANPLVPVKPGATWTYRNSSGGVSPSFFATTITDVRLDGFTVSTVFADSAKSDQKWGCKPEGLVALSLGTGQTALRLPAQGIEAELIASNASGLTLPAKVQPGMKWPYRLDVAGSISQGNLIANGKGSISTAMEAVGTELVTVPAGTFEAMKIQSVSTLNVTADYHGFNIPLTATINATFWLAPGVGWIKSTETGEFAGASVNTITELQSYDIP
jgi:hypothetical protein